MNAVIFHDVTDKTPPSCFFMVGDIVEWNDTFISLNSPVRVYCGEGPFTVIAEESFIIEFSCSSKSSDLKVGNDHLVLEDPTTKRIIEAHGGLFKSRSL